MRINSEAFQFAGCCSKHALFDKLKFVGLLNWPVAAANSAARIVAAPGESGAREF